MSGIDTLSRDLGPDAQSHGLTRRAALGAFTAGYAAALATEAAEAQAITTSSEDLIEERVSFPAHGGHQLPAFVTRRDGPGRRAVVIVVNEVFGIHAYIQDVCRRFAQLGYVAVAPDYFHRAGDPSTLTEWDQIRAIVNTASHAQVMGDTDAAIAWASAQPFGDGARIAITGFCWGGTVVWMAAASNPAVKAGVAWYGRLVAREGATEDRLYPVDIASSLTAPVLGLYAENDGGIPLDTVETLRARLAEAAPTNPAAAASRIEVFPGTEHGFHADYRRQYNAPAATAGWAKLLDWFRAAGV